MLINLAAPQVWQPSWLIFPRVSGVCRWASTKAHGKVQWGDPACYPSRKPVPSKITQNLYEYFSRKTILLYNLRKQNFEYDKCLALKNRWISDFWLFLHTVHSTWLFTLQSYLEPLTDMFHQPCTGGLLRPTRATGSGWPGQEACMNSLLNSPVHPKAQVTADKVQAQREGTPSQIQQEWVTQTPTHHSRRDHMMLQGKASLRIDFTDTFNAADNQ